jgi:hypothetical protein
MSKNDLLKKIRKYTNVQLALAGIYFSEIGTQVSNGGKLAKPSIGQNTPDQDMSDYFGQTPVTTTQVYNGSRLEKIVLTKDGQNKFIFEASGLKISKVMDYLSQKLQNGYTGTVEASEVHGNVVLVNIKAIPQRGAGTNSAELITELNGPMIYSTNEKQQDLREDISESSESMQELKKAISGTMIYNPEITFKYKTIREFFNPERNVDNRSENVEITNDHNLSLIRLVESHPKKGFNIDMNKRYIVALTVSERTEHEDYPFYTPDRHIYMEHCIDTTKDRIGRVFKLSDETRATIEAIYDEFQLKRKGPSPGA